MDIDSEIIDLYKSPLIKYIDRDSTGIILEYLDDIKRYDVELRFSNIGSNRQCRNIDEALINAGFEMTQNKSGTFFYTDTIKHNIFYEKNNYFKEPMYLIKQLTKAEKDLIGNINCSYGSMVMSCNIKSYCKEVPRIKKGKNSFKEFVESDDFKKNSIDKAIIGLRRTDNGSSTIAELELNLI